MSPRRQRALQRRRGSAARAALPMCAIGAITITGAPYLSAPSPTLHRAARSLHGRQVHLLRRAVTGFYREWLRNGAVVSGPTWTTGGNFAYGVGAADVGATIRSAVMPCNAEGCYGSYVLSSNAVTADQSRALPADESRRPATARAADSLTPTLSATFSDPDGQSGHASTSTSSARPTASPSPPATARPWAPVERRSGRSRAGKLTPGGKYKWTASPTDASGAGGGTSGPNWYGANPVWLYSSCATDGERGGDDVRPAGRRRISSRIRRAPTRAPAPTASATRLGDSIAAAGVSTRLDSPRPPSRRTRRRSRRAAVPASTYFTGRWGWLIFNLIPSGNGGLRSESGRRQRLLRHSSGTAGPTTRTACRRRGRHAQQPLLRPLGRQQPGRQVGPEPGADPGHVGLVGDARRARPTTIGAGTTATSRATSA